MKGSRFFGDVRFTLEGETEGLNERGNDGSADAEGNGSGIQVYRTHTEVAFRCQQQVPRAAVVMTMMIGLSMSDVALLFHLDLRFMYVVLLTLF